MGSAYAPEFLGRPSTYRVEADFRLLGEQEIRVILGQFLEHIFKLIAIVFGANLMIDIPSINLSASPATYLR